MSLAFGDNADMVAIDALLLANQRLEIIKSFPNTKALLSLVSKANHHAIRTPQRSVTNSELHHTDRHVNEVAVRLPKN